MTRKTISAIAIGLVALIIGLDLTQAQPNPYMAPDAFALWSGQIQSGGFCGALPE